MSFCANAKWNTEELNTSNIRICWSVLHDIRPHSFYQYFSIGTTAFWFIRLAFNYLQSMSVCDRQNCSFRMPIMHNIRMVVICHYTLDIQFEWHPHDCSIIAGVFIPFSRMTTCIAFCYFVFFICLLFFLWYHKVSITLQHQYCFLDVLQSMNIERTCYFISFAQKKFHCCVSEFSSCSFWICIIEQ